MRPTVLLADDSASIRRVVELTFADEAIDVVSVASGSEAKARLEDIRPSVVLADASLPDGDGYDVCGFVKHHASLGATPVVLLTAAGEPVDEARARAACCDSLLQKPFEGRQVVELVRTLLEGRVEPWHVRARESGGQSAPAGPGGRSAAGEDAFLDELGSALASAGLTTSISTIEAGSPLEPDPAPSGPAASRPRAADAAGDDQRPGHAPTLADFFAILLARETGESVAWPGRDAAGVQAAEPSPELVDAVFCRVLERFSDHAVREAVSAHVVEVAERLVREEIDRIKARAGR